MLLSMDPSAFDVTTLSSSLIIKNEKVVPSNTLPLSVYNISLYAPSLTTMVSYLNITDVSNQKIQYQLDSSGATCALYGANDMVRTNWIFKKVG